ncbi:hypothetical protein M0R45_026246 [Rubus argutus]|uniref:Uncharacterized protein n=1 Tax=Rubus argutus TaxID=59490 RepID=A0AAW1WX15_RUBAR
MWIPSTKTTFTTKVASTGKNHIKAHQAANSSRGPSVHQSTVDATAKTGAIRFSHSPIPRPPPLHLVTAPANQKPKCPAHSSVAAPVFSSIRTSLRREPNPLPSRRDSSLIIVVDAALHPLLSPSSPPWPTATSLPSRHTPHASSHLTVVIYALARL